MFNKQKRQNLLKKQYTQQKSTCDCGLPIPPMIRIMKEGFFCEYRIYEDHKYICKNCNKVHIRIG